MANAAMTEEQMISMVRNALLVAGQEMGDGDQWPVVKDTIHKIMKDWEQLRVERAVDAELKTHLYEQLKEMEAGLPECTAAIQAELAPRLQELRQIYDAHFSDLDRHAVFYDDSREPEHIKRMKAIISTLEGNND